MKNCYQFKDLSVYDHGIMVHEYFLDIYEYLQNGSELKYEWKIPEHILNNKEFLLSNIHDLNIIKQYSLLHDCGKPYCLVYDEYGKKHFPNHSEKSYEVYKKLYDNDIVANLIRQDMDLHLLKDKGIDAFCEKPLSDICTLILISLSEIHANAEMFGGIESTNFKIKYKNIEKRTKKILEKIK